jgi:hypothetical protein
MLWACLLDTVGLDVGVILHVSIGPLVVSIPFDGVDVPF